MYIVISKPKRMSQAAGVCQTMMSLLLGFTIRNRWFRGLLHRSERPDTVPMVPGDGLMCVKESWEVVS